MIIMGGCESKECPKECPKEDVKENVKKCYYYVNPVVDVKDIEMSQDYNCWMNTPKGMMGNTFGSKKDCLNKCMSIDDCVGYLYPVDGKIPYTVLRGYNSKSLYLDKESVENFEKNSTISYNYKPFKDTEIRCGTTNTSIFNMGDSKRINILQPGLDYKNSAIRLDKSMNPDLRGKSLKNLVIGSLGK